MGAINIPFDPDDIAECERAVRWLAQSIALHHGRVTVRRLFIAEAASKRELQKDANLLLMVNYVYFQLSAKLSAKRCARMLAEKNKSLPWGRRYGGGSTNQEALEKQIRREKRRMKADDRYREDVEESVASLLYFNNRYRDRPSRFRSVKDEIRWERTQAKMEDRTRERVRGFVAVLLNPNGYRDTADIS